MKKIYLMADFIQKKYIQNLLPDFEINIIDEKNLAEKKLENKNIIVFCKEVISDKIKKNFKNNFLIFYLKKNNDDLESINQNVQIVKGPIKINQLKEMITNHFQNEFMIYEDFKITGDNIQNLTNKKNCFLTNLEKFIIIELIKNKSVSRDYFLEKILGLKKNIETKTIESHLTRIRKKLLNIDSKVQILSKDNNIFLKI